MTIRSDLRGGVRGRDPDGNGPGSLPPGRGGMCRHKLYIHIYIHTYYNNDDNDSNAFLGENNTQ